MKKQERCPTCGQIAITRRGFTKCPLCGGIQLDGTLTVKGSDMVDKAYLVMFNDANGLILGLRITDEKKLAVELGDGDARELLARFHAVLDATVTELYEALEPKP